MVEDGFREKHYTYVLLYWCVAVVLMNSTCLIFINLSVTADHHSTRRPTWR